MLNIPDTVGYAIPDEFAELIEAIMENVRGIEGVVVSVHCHNDLGLAVANSLAALERGARQVECAVNGLGERAGNASLEEIVMTLKVRHDRLGLNTGVNSTEISRTSRLVSLLTGYQVQPNKAIVGRNAFAHESGIHQDGVLKERTTYEIMDSASVGLVESDIVLGKHSGRHALSEQLERLGYFLNEEELEPGVRALQGARRQEGVALRRGHRGRRSRVHPDRGTAVEAHRLRGAQRRQRGAAERDHNS